MVIFSTYKFKTKPFPRPPDPRKTFPCTQMKLDLITKYDFTANKINKLLIAVVSIFVLVTLKIDSLKQIVFDL